MCVLKFQTVIYTLILTFCPPGSKAQKDWTTNTECTAMVTKRSILIMHEKKDNSEINSNFSV